MMIGFLEFEDETVLALGLTNDDLANMIAGREPPMIDLARLAIDLDAKLPTQILIMVGDTEEAMSERIGRSLEDVPHDDVVPLTDDVSDKYLYSQDGAIVDNTDEAAAILRAIEKLGGE